MKPSHPVCLMLAAWLLIVIMVPADAGLLFRHKNDTYANCDGLIPPITSGYGADGQYQLSSSTIPNPSLHRKPVQVFFPQGATGKLPVIFFSHGFGPGKWESYADLIRHMVSRGYIVVFSSYAQAFTSIDGRYSSLWQGFQAAAEKYADRMDLSRVGFVGHSFGGGATPAMAYRGIVQHGWGKHGAFLMELAPWYVSQMNNGQLGRFPAGVLQVTEVYEQDDTNDHRMAIDIHAHTHMTDRYYLLVHSASIKGCAVKADHATPGRNTSLRQKQYAVFRPFDALADAAFNASTAARTALSDMAQTATGSAYQPLSLETQPAPLQPESYYRYPWSGKDNPRRDGF
ncbi:MAG TPA: hypothetical protein VF117_02975 [Gammaproteobacteria bacterium]